MQKNNHISFWKQQIENSTKLSFYGSFKQQYELEDILTLLKDPVKEEYFRNFVLVTTN